MYLQFMSPKNKNILILDGYNVIKTGSDQFVKMQTLEAQRQHLIKILKSSLSSKYDKIIVVFDGQAPDTTAETDLSGGITVIYSKRGREADEIIQKLIRKESGQNQVNIISSDRKIINAARDHTITVKNSQYFWQSMVRKHHGNRKTTEGPAESDRQLSDKEVTEWMKIFKKSFQILKKENLL